MLVVFETPHTKRMLAKYGPMVVGVDATFKTTKYRLPLFLLVVKKNDDIGCCVPCGEGGPSLHCCGSQAD